MSEPVTSNVRVYALDTGEDGEPAMVELVADKVPNFHYPIGSLYVPFSDYLALRGAHETSDPPVLGAGAGPSPMPTVSDAVMVHVREIQKLCDAANLDPAQWLTDEYAGGCF